MDTFVFEIALLVGHMGDQFFVQASPDVGEIDCLHANPFQTTPFPDVSPSQDRR